MTARRWARTRRWLTLLAFAPTACFDDGGGQATDSTGVSQTGTSASDGGTSSDNTGGTLSTGNDSAGGTGATGGADTTDGSSCGGVCVSEVPETWQGPVVVWEDSIEASIPGCVGAYGTKAGDFFSGIDPGTADCSCTCSEAQGIECTTPVQLCYNSGGAQCYSLCVDPPKISPGACTNVTTSSSNVSVGNPAPTKLGTCTPSENHTLDTPKWETAVRTCGGATTDPVGCDQGEVCAPTVVAPFERLCIVSAGDVECPPGSFTEKSVVFDDFQDNRSCSECSCGTAESQCNGVVDFVNSTGGGSCNILVASVSAGGCGSHGSAPQAIYSPNPEGTCPPQGGELSGEVTPTGAATLCCQPEPASFVQRALRPDSWSWPVHDLGELRVVGHLQPKLDTRLFGAGMFPPR